MTTRTNQLRDFYSFDLFEHSNQTGNNWVVTKTRINYLTPVKYNREVWIKTRLICADDRRLVVEAVMTSKEKNRLHAVAWIEFAYFNIEKARPARHSVLLIEFFKSVEQTVAEFHIEKIEQRVADLIKKTRRLTNHADAE